MATSVTEDVLSGLHSRSTNEGDVYNRRIILSGLESTPGSTLAWRAQDDPLVPQIGDAHPAVATLICESRDIGGFLNDRTSVIIDCQYRDMSAVRILRNTLLVNTTSRFDFEGNRLVVARTGNESCPAEGPLLVPNTIVEFHTYDFGKWADEFDMLYAGRLNGDRWQGEEKHTWLCLGVTGGPWDVLGRVAIHQRKYGFLFKGAKFANFADAHMVMLWWRARNMPTPPPEIDPKADGFSGGHDAVYGDGWGWEQMQPDAIFSSLYLPSIWETRTTRVL